MVSVPNTHTQNSHSKLLFPPLRHITLLLLLLTLTPGLHAQQNLTIVLLDKNSSEPVPFAHVCFEDQQTGKQFYQMSDVNGRAAQPYQGRTVVAVSVMGYKTRMDTINTYGSYTFMLEPAFFDMDEVVITAQMSPKRVDQSIYQVKVINSKLISEKAASNLADLLSGELNLRVSQDGALGSSMSLNGLGGEHVKILIDGVPVIGRLNGNIDLSQLNLNNVDHIEIVEGPMSVQYGSNALAGAINIITKENTRNKLLTSVKTYYESVGIYNASASLDINQKSHFFSVNGGRNFFGGFSRPDTARTQLWKPKEQYFSEGSYVFRKNNMVIRADGKFFRETILNKGKVRGTYEIWALDNYFVTDRYTTKAQFINNHIGENGRIDIMGSWSGYSRIKNTYRKDLTSLAEIISSDATLQDTTIFSSFLSRGSYAWQPESKKVAIQTGFDVNYETGEGKRILNGTQSMGDYAAFISTEYNPSKRISFQPGFRFAYNTRYKAPIVPSINLKWSPVNDFDVRLSYVRGFRAPSLKELYLYFVDINHDVRGNPDLQSENSHNMNASVLIDRDWSNNFYGLEINTFSNIIKNKIDLVNDSATVYSYANINEFRSIGFNLKLKYKLHPRLNVSLGIARTGTFSSIAEIERKIDNFSFSTDYAGEFRYDMFNNGTNLSLFYKYNGKYPYYYRNSEDAVALGYMDPYSSLDISVTKSFLKKNLMLSIGGKNLFNITNIPKVGANGAAHSGGDGGGTSPVGWGRTFFIGLNYKFGTF